jgi:uncharacterized protein (TIGR04255 family)
MARRSKGSTRLPKAPLAEVVFELRWTLQKGPDNQAILHSDPGIMPLLDAFTSHMKKAKFGFFRDMSHPLQTGPYGVVRRYFRDSESPYPIMQVGIGIFATNASSQYDYPNFREQVLSGIAALLNSYPKMDFFPLRPDHLELRYVDVFDQNVMEGVGFFNFLNSETAFKVGLPPMLGGSKQVTGKAQGRVIYEAELKDWKGSRIIVDLGSALQETTNEDAIRMVTLVRTTLPGVPELKTKGTFPKQVAKWLDFAHGITSPLFKEIISDNVMRKFKEL